MVICLERGADLHMFQLMPLPLTVSCFSKIQIGFAFLVPADLVVPEKWPLNVCVCVCVCVSSRVVESGCCIVKYLCVSSWRCGVREQQSSDAVVAVVRGDVQRSQTVQRRSVHVDTSALYQQPSHLDTAVLAGHVQCRVALL